MIMGFLSFFEKDIPLLRQDATENELSDYLNQLPLRLVRRTEKILGLENKRGRVVQVLNITMALVPTSEKINIVNLVVTTRNIRMRKAMELTPAVLAALINLISEIKSRKLNVQDILDI